MDKKLHHKVKTITANGKIIISMVQALKYLLMDHTMMVTGNII